MGHAMTIRDNLQELEQSAQRLTQAPPDATQPESLIVDGDNEDALPPRLPLPDLLPEGQRIAVDTPALSLPGTAWHHGASVAWAG